jgi:hypothetical protein
MSSKLRIFGLLFCFAVLTGNVFADTLPPDPIVDLEGGSGSNSYFGGMVSVTFNGIVGQNCSTTASSVGDTTIVTCGTTTSFIRPGDPAQGGVFSNDTGVDITNIHVHIDTFFGLNGTGGMAGVSEGTFSEFPSQANGLFPGPIIPDADGNGATFTGGDIVGCPVTIALAPCTPGEFKIGYAEVLIPEGGSAVIEFDANHSLPAPEPATLALLAMAVPGVWMIRKKKLI